MEYKGLYSRVPCMEVSELWAPLARWLAEWKTTSCLQGIIPGPNGPVEYIRVHYFSGETSRAFSETLRDAKGNGRYGIIVDLRNNPGMLPHQ